MIYMKNCVFFVCYGFFDEEVFFGQCFFVDVCLDVEVEVFFQEDKFDGMVDYGVVFKVIELVVFGQWCYLIEVLVVDIVIGFCEKFLYIKCVEIIVCKFNVLVLGVFDYVEVMVMYVL